MQKEEKSCEMADPAGKAGEARTDREDLLVWSRAGRGQVRAAEAPNALSQGHQQGWDDR